LDESDLIRRAMNGDAAAWEPLMRIHQEAVFRLSYLLLGDPDDAEDVAQETFLRAWNRIESFDPARRLQPWLLSIASNLASNHRRSAGRYLSALMRTFRISPPIESIEERNIKHMQAVELWKAVRTLNERDQKIVYMRYFLDLSVAETAEALNIAEGTVKSRLSRSLDKLRINIQNDFPSLKKGYE